MAKKVQTKSTEEILWDSANKLLGSVEPSEYIDMVLRLIFFVFTNDKFRRRVEALMAALFQQEIELKIESENVFANLGYPLK